MKVFVIGAGLGGTSTLTVGALGAIDQCAVLIGASRLLEPYGDKTCYPYINAPDIAACIRNQTEGPVGVLLSGDVGFYSGAKGLWPLLKNDEVEVFPGVSSLGYFCARLHTPWQDARLVSAHGRAHNAVGEIQSNEKTFVLTGGETRVGDLCAELTRRGLGAVRISVGENLSYPEERIVTGTAAELADWVFDDLSVILAENEHPIGRTFAAPGIPDAAFLRGEAPMTKEEVRVVSLGKLRPRADHIIWDVGAGTGSVSVELALAASEGRVYAVEKKAEAVALLRKNKERFGVANLEIIEGEAPECLTGLPAPDRVFLGGTSGDLTEIVCEILRRNPAVRLVVNAVTLETLAEAARCLGQLGFHDVDVTQVAVTRTREAGRYHLMDAQNPVWVISGEGRA